MAVVIVIADPQPHPSLLPAVRIQRDSALETSFRERAVASVPEQKAGRGVARDVDIRPAVAIEVGSSRRERIIRLHRQYAGLLAHIGEGCVSVVMVQADPLLRKAIWSAKDRNPSANARGVLAANRNVVRIEIAVTHAKEIPPAVAIVIDPGATRAVVRARTQ